MTRTELDLRRALDSLDDPDALHRLTGLVRELSAGADVTLHRVPARRRLVAPLLAAAAVIGLAGAVVVLTSDDPAPTPPGGPTVSAADLRPQWIFSIGAVDGFTNTRVAITRLDAATNIGEVARIQTAAGAAGERGLLVITPPGVDEPKQSERTPQAVQVAGRPGTFVPGAHLSPDTGLRDDLYAQPWLAAYDLNEFGPSLRWTYADGTSAELSGTFGFDPGSYDYDNAAGLVTMQRIAAAVRVGVDEPVTMPFGLGAVPNGVAPESVRYLSNARVPCLGYGTGAGPYPGEWAGSVMTVCRVTTGTDRAATIAATTIHEDQASSVTVRDLGDGTSLVIEVDYGQQDAVSADQAQALAAAADVSPTLADPSTWLPVD